MPRAVLGLGGNLGARRALLGCARTLLVAQPGLSLLGSSRLYHTAPLGPPQPEYLNAALLIDWVGSARGLLCVTQHVELLLQRQRNERWGARTLDIDILHWSTGPVREPGLTVPHPELARRAFALVPLLEVAPGLSAELTAPAESLATTFACTEPFDDPVRDILPAPGTARFAAAPGELRIGPLLEPLDLASAFVAGLGRYLPGQVRANAVLPFVCSGFECAAVSLEPLLEALHGRTVAALKHGFFVRKAAITNVGQGRCEGVFVGAHVASRLALPALSWRLEPGAHGQALRLNHA